MVLCIDGVCILYWKYDILYMKCIRSLCTDFGTPGEREREIESRGNAPVYVLNLSRSNKVVTNYVCLTSRTRRPTEKTSKTSKAFLGKALLVLKWSVEARLRPPISCQLPQSV